MHIFSGVGVLLLALAMACGHPDRPPPATGAEAPPAASVSAAPPSPSGSPSGVAAEETPFTEAELYPYPLDDVSREVPARGRVKCPEVELVRYAGDVIRYHKPLKIYKDFQPRLHRFEEIVRDTAIEFYGRAPRRIRHLGSYYCRRIRSWPTYISEHGLGNALDVEGFDFDWISKKKAPETPANLRQGLRVRVLDHWGSTRGVGAVHDKFLRTLAERLIEERPLFRVMLGPNEPGHQNHFHFDVAPWRFVNIFETPAFLEPDVAAEGDPS